MSNFLTITKDYIFCFLGVTCKRLNFVVLVGALGKRECAHQRTLHLSDDAGLSLNKNTLIKMPFTYSLNFRIFLHQLIHTSVRQFCPTILWLPLERGCSLRWQQLTS